MQFPIRVTKLKVASAVLAVFIAAANGAWAQPSRTAASLDHVSRLTTYKFIQRDGTCIYGTISKADATAIIVQESSKPPVTVERETLLQVGQGDALLFSARSSWADVAAVNVYPREALVITILSGKRIRGRPVKVSDDAITLKHELRETRYPKTDISSVDYLRVKPATDGFLYLGDEAPFMLFFYPEFYYRLMGIEGRISVRLYDATKPEDNAPIHCSNP